MSVRLFRLGLKLDCCTEALLRNLCTSMLEDETNTVLDAPDRLQLFVRGPDLERLFDINNYLQDCQRIQTEIIDKRRGVRDALERNARYVGYDPFNLSRYRRGFHRLPQRV